MKSKYLFKISIKTTKHNFSGNICMFLDRLTEDNIKKIKNEYSKHINARFGTNFSQNDCSCDFIYKLDE